MRFALIICAASLAHTLCAGPLPQHAREYQQLLRDRLLPYWYDSTRDPENGGYLLADDVKGRKVATEKQLVSQARMVWTFSHVHRKGFSDRRRNYLEAAEQGYRFLVRHFRDELNGGYFWKTDLAGQPLNLRKVIYGQAFVIYALVEYHRAGGSKEPLNRALALHQLLQRRAHDTEHGGWIEHFQRDWQPILKPQSGAEVEVPGYKSANAHLHLMEAFAELYEATHDPEVKKSLEESIQINTEYFYPERPGKSCFHRHLDWKAVKDPKSAGLSYGHNVEFAWLLMRAEQVLGRRRSWPHFNAHVEHALKYGYDQDRGGLYNRGEDNEPATQTDKVWWVQAEMMAALSEGLRRKARPAWSNALDRLVHFVNEHQTDPLDGVWLDTVTAEGKPKNTAKAHSWKANYHDVRALVKFIETFPARP
jgi:cellobiose epimerase